MILNLKIRFTWIINIFLMLLLLISVIGSISGIYGQIQAIPAVPILTLTICFVLFGIVMSFFPKLFSRFINFIKTRRKTIFIQRKPMFETEKTYVYTFIIN